MPTYEYACKACGHCFERQQPITSTPVRTCPKCGKRRVARVIGPGGGLLFKGSGFYITDYRSSGYKEKAKADADKGKPAEAKPKADAKTETKTETKKPEEKKPAKK